CISNRITRLLVPGYDVSQTKAMTNIVTRTTRLAKTTGLRESPGWNSVERVTRSAGSIRPGLVLAIVLVGQFMAVLDASIVNAAAPSTHAGWDGSGASLQPIGAGYPITYAVLLVTGARLGDILGPRRMFLAGVVAFTLASLGCGIAPTAGELIGLRFVQGAGA